MRATLTFAPEWTDEDRQAVAEYVADQAHNCPGCGGDLRETTDPENARRWLSEPIVCHRCVAVASAQAKTSDWGVEAERRAALFPITERT